MINQWDIIYEYCDTHPDCEIHGVYRVSPPADSVVTDTLVASLTVPTIDLRTSVHSNPKKRSVTFAMPIPMMQFLGIMLLALGIGGIVGPLIPEMRMETAYYTAQAQLAINKVTKPPAQILPASAPVIFNPLVTPDGAPITPVNTDFSLVVPSIGINAPIVANVDPTKHSVYSQALLNGIAQASTSFTPDQNGTMYLFSHDTNYDWFVKDLNAVFYLLKNVKQGDLTVVFYQGKRYTYKITDKKVVSSTDTSYLIPTAGKKSLILETCWPPGSTAQRLLIFADLVEDGGQTI